MRFGMYECGASDDGPGWLSGEPTVPQHSGAPLYSRGAPVGRLLSMTIP